MWCNKQRRIVQCFYCTRRSLLAIVSLLVVLFSCLICFACEYLVPPRLSSSPSDVRILVGSIDFSWKCIASANPSAVISWEKDGRRVVSSTSVTVAGNGAQLILSQVRPSHSGVYRCVAENYLAVADASASLFVIGMFRFLIAFFV